MKRVYNFSAGPAVLPEEVLREAADEMLDYKGCGMSVMEMSHRSKAFAEIIETAEQDLRDLMGIPDNYKVLFLQGGASQQFAMIPMNLMKNKVADYIVTGQWAKKAAAEASKYGKVNKIASSEDKTFSYIPDCSDLPVDEDADYVYICENNTIYGTKFKELPNTKGKTLVADVSSCFLSEPVDVTKYGLIYGGVQKNIGPAGVVIAIIREDLITEDVLPGTPTMLTYKTHADAGSLYNTPPAYGIYICGKVFKWLKKMGGLEVMKERNEKKAKLLYDYLDQSKLFKGTVEKKDRSLMNVPFVTGSDELDAKFVKEAKEAGLENLKDAKSIAMADGSVPVGKYTRQAMVNAGMLDAVDDVSTISTDVISQALDGVEINECGNVSAVKTQVAEGSNEVGTAYYSDTYGLEDKLDILQVISYDLTGNVIYPIAQVKNDEADELEQKAALDFVNFVKSDAAKAIFDSYYFDTNVED